MKTITWDEHILLCKNVPNYTRILTPGDKNALVELKQRGKRGRRDFVQNLMDDACRLFELCGGRRTDTNSTSWIDNVEGPLCQRTTLTLGTHSP